MRVKFIGEIPRTNSFGTFEPGKTYDVSATVGEQLLAVPTLFRLEEAGKRMRKTTKADTQVVDVTDEIVDKYKACNINELKAIVRERGLSTRRGARKAELVQLLEDDDQAEAEKKKEEDNGDDGG